LWERVASVYFYERKIVFEAKEAQRAEQQI
jgi:hypothetical protein